MDEVVKLVDKIKQRRIAEGDSGKCHIKVELRKNEYAAIWKWQITIFVTLNYKSEISYKSFRKKRDAEDYFETIVKNYGLTKTSGGDD